MNNLVESEHTHLGETLTYVDANYILYSENICKAAFNIMQVFAFFAWRNLSEFDLKIACQIVYCI